MYLFCHCFYIVQNVSLSVYLIFLWKRDFRSRFIFCEDFQYHNLLCPSAFPFRCHEHAQKYDFLICYFCEVSLDQRLTYSKDFWGCLFGYPMDVVILVYVIVNIFFLKRCLYKDLTIRVRVIILRLLACPPLVYGGFLQSSLQSTENPRPLIKVINKQYGCREITTFLC